MHIEVVITIGSLFLLLGIVVLFLHFQAIRMRRTSWRDWCHRHAGQLSGAEMLQRLDDLLRNSSWYVTLQRMTLVAPLLGVLITVLGLYRLNTSSIVAGDPASILTAIRPVYFGVGLGASLAIMQQVLLVPIAAAQIARVRLQAEADLPDTLSDPVAAALHAFAERLQSLSQVVEERIVNIEQQSQAAVSHLAESVLQLTQKIDATVTNCDAGGAALADAATRFSSSIKDMCDQITSGVTAIRQTVSKSGKSLGTQLTKSETSLVAASTDLDSSVRVMAANLDACQTAVKTLVQQQEQASAAQQTINRSAGAIIHDASDVLKNVQEVLPATSLAAMRMEEATGSFTTSAETVREASESIKGFAGQSMQLLATVRQSVQTAQATLEALHHAVAKFNEAQQIRSPAVWPDPSGAVPGSDPQQDTTDGNKSWFGRLTGR